MDVAAQKPECVSAHPTPQDESLALLIIKGANIYTARLEPRKRQMVSAMPFVFFRPQ